jgi:hypothetical protein
VAPPQECIEAIFKGAGSHHVPLARHGCALLYLTASATESASSSHRTSSNNDLDMFAELLLTALRQNTLNTKDMMCCTYVLQAIAALAMRESPSLPTPVVLNLYMEAANTNLISHPRYSLTDSSFAFDSSPSIS